MKGPPKIENYIYLNGKEKRIDDMPEKERRKIAVIIQDNIMRIAGYKRKTG